MKTTIQIKGMHCKSCEALIKEVLEDAAGVSSAQVSLPEGIARVDFDEKSISKDKLCELIESEGYTAN